MSESILYICQCIDTEGPMYESLTATFKRIEDFTGINIKPSADTLLKIQNGEINLNGYEEITKQAFSKRCLDYNKTWHDLDNMLDIVTKDEFRNKYKDSFGNGWIYNWFIVDLPICTVNPRHRDQGYNNIFDHYNEYYTLNQMSINSGRDEFHWHAHPANFYDEAHHCGTSYLNSPHIFESLCHRVIDCHDFPSCFTAGFHTERPDSHWFLEQYIPFDFSNQAMKFSMNDLKQHGVADGQGGDWRRADASWAWYHPAHDDYQVRGNCNRVIFRRLNIGTRLRLLTQEEVDSAFRRVSEGESTVLAFCDHDFRNFIPDVDEIYGMLLEAHTKYPNVKWVNSGALSAAKRVTGMQTDALFELNITIEDNRLHVTSSENTFGPQPFLAVKTKLGKYVLLNFDFQVPRREWSFVFGNESIHWSDIELIGIASNSLRGSGALYILDQQGIIKIKKQW